MKEQLLAMEHYRLHVVEEWAEGPKKDAAIAAIRSAIAGLTLPGQAFGCSICQGPKRPHETQQSLDRIFGIAA